jgi:hypothetical protein
MKNIALLFVFALLPLWGFGQLQLALLKYSGGGDWYSNPTALPNLAAFCNQYIKTDFTGDYATVEVGSADIFNYPFLYMTGHGNVVFSDAQAENLRTYLLAGGFLHVDDNYGMDPYLRLAMKKVFPDKDWVELPFSHPIYDQAYRFANGLPKIHKHDGLPPQGLAILHEGRVIVYYTYETDLGNGWEDQSVHNDPEEKRREALKMGANIIQFAFTQ